MFVGGQSMGALTSLHLMLRDESPWRGVVLGTATIDVEWNWVLRYILLPIEHAVLQRKADMGPKTNQRCPGRISLSS